MPDWTLAKAEDLGRGDIITLSGVTESVVSVIKGDTGRLTINREGTRPIEVRPDDQVEVWR